MLVNESKQSLNNLKDYLNIGQSIFKNLELCRNLE